MQFKHKIKESLEWIVYDANGNAVAACRDSETATNLKPDHGYVYHHSDMTPDVPYISGDDSVNPKEE